MEDHEKLGELEKIDIGGHKLEVIHDEGEDPYIVFVHGGPGSLWNPIEQLKAFHKDKGTVSYSLTGYGNSDSRKDDSLDKHVEDLRKLLETLEIDSFVLHGHSYGTEIVLNYAEKYNVDGLIISGGSAYLKPPLWEKTLTRLVLGLRLYNGPFMNTILQRTAKMALHSDIDQSDLEEIIETTPAPRRRSAWKTLPDCFWNYETPDLDKITAPTLIIQGREDHLASLENVKRMAEELPNAELKIFDNSGHVPMIEQRDKYNDAVRQFIEQRVAKEVQTT